MSGPVIPSRDAWAELVKMYQWWRSYKTQGAQNGQLGQSERRISRHPLRMAITTEEIEPDTYGEFRFATGAKGEEIEGDGPFRGFYRASQTEDPPNLPSGTLCFAIWVPCDSLPRREAAQVAVL